jgi:hypothetical protein
MQHELLRSRDLLISAGGGYDTLLKRIEDAEHTEVWDAMRRIDRLEDQQEALRHEVLWAAKQHEVVTAQVLESARAEMASVKSSLTWKLGRLASAPVRLIRRGVRR